MLIIYGSDLSSPSNKVRFVANAIGIKYDYKIVKLREGEHRSEWFLKLNPAGKIPVIDDGGFVLFESNAICKYLAEKHSSPLYPRDLKQRALVDQWMDFCSSHVGGALYLIIMNRIFAPIRKIPVNEPAIQEGFSQLDRYFPVVEQQLSKNNFLAGDAPTLADMNLLSQLDPVELAQIDISGYPNLVHWRKDLRQKDFYTKCFKEYGESLKAAAVAAKG